MFFLPICTEFERIGLILGPFIDGIVILACLRSLIFVVVA